MPKLPSGSDARVRPSPERSSALAIAADVAREPMFALLLLAGGLYALIGDLVEGSRAR